MTQRSIVSNRKSRTQTGAKRWRPLALMLLLAISPGLNAAEPAERLVTMGSGSTVEFTSPLSPLTINQLHSWVIKLRDKNGSAIEGATLVFDAGMPEHDHGLPTTPQTTAEIRPGDYLVEGVRFHMNGHWVLSVSVTLSGQNSVQSAELSLDI